MSRWGINKVKMLSMWFRLYQRGINLARKFVKVSTSKWYQWSLKWYQQGLNCCQRSPNMAQRGLILDEISFKSSIKTTGPNGMSEVNKLINKHTQT